jgi:ABC-type multidrug transport system fused ATPase/permease subunit
MIQYLSKILYILVGKKHSLFILLAFMVLTSLLDTIGIGLIGPFIGLASAPSSIEKNSRLSWFYTQSGLESYGQFIALFGFIILIIFYIKSFLNFHVQKYIFRFSCNQRGKLSVKLLHAYLTLPYTFHLKRNTAILIQNIVSETNVFCSRILLPTLSSIAYIIIIVFLALLLIKTDFAASFAVLGILLIPFLLYHRYKDRLAYWGKETSKSQIEMIRIINHSLGGLKETRVIGCESYFENQIGKQTQRLEAAVNEYQTFNLLPRIVIEAFLITFLVGFTSLFLISNRSAQSLTAVLGVFAVASIRLIPSVSQLVNSVSGIRNSSHSLNKLYFDLKELEKFDIHKIPSNLNSSGARQSIDSEGCSTQSMSFIEQLDLTSITYCYPKESDPALKNISLTIKKGQAIGLIGKSGAGKTTLVDVLIGLLTPESGDIKVDGVSIYNDLRSWQNLIGYIPQSIFLIDDTIEKNIAFGVVDDQIDQERLSRALEAAQLQELVEQMPENIKTLVGERGVRLSGGQRQRVGIARALYHEREILILDEATAALDNETEMLVNEAIKSLSGTKTLIIIAHRLTTVEHCDHIYLLDKGCVQDSGSYREVVLKR